MSVTVASVASLAPPFGGQGAPAGAYSVVAAVALKLESAIPALAGRVWGHETPERDEEDGPSLPYVTVSLPSRVPLNGSTSTHDFNRVQVDLYAESGEKADDLAELIDDALHRKYLPAALRRAKLVAIVRRFGPIEVLERDQSREGFDRHRRIFDYEVVTNKK